LEPHEAVCKDSLEELVSVQELKNMPQISVLRGGQAAADLKNWGSFWDGFSSQKPFKKMVAKSVPRGFKMGAPGAKKRHKITKKWVWEALEKKSTHRTSDYLPRDP